MHAFLLVFVSLRGTESFPSLSTSIYAAHNYERRIRSFFGLEPVGHSDTRPLILHEQWPASLFPLRKDFVWDKRTEDSEDKYEFRKIEGEGVYEIPVGPIHAGIIEPGHFRFSVVGEQIVNLEPKLGYTHKGSEKLLEVLPLEKKLALSEKISGDSSFSHALAFTQAIEQLGNIEVPARALYLRVIYAELERIANHIGDIGAIMMDTGFNFGGAQGARLREMMLRINSKLTGSRFLRGVVTFGGVTKDISTSDAKQLLCDIESIEKDFREVIAIAESSTSLLNRLKGTGKLSPHIAERGILGVVGKALGVEKDARKDYPYAAYAQLAFADVALEDGGDVYARFGVRIKEVYSSIALIQKAIAEMPKGEYRSKSKSITLSKSAYAIGVVEGWRGDIVYFVSTDAQGAIQRVFPRDPSFVNWDLLPEAGFDNVVPDFPLINKSFNMSYTGNDC